MVEEREPGIVTVTAGEHEFRALGEPQFLIKVGDKYYATVALLEYDPKAPPKGEQIQGVQHVEHLFHEAAARGPTHVAVGLTTPALTGGGASVSSGATNPPPKSH